MTRDQTSNPTRRDVIKLIGAGAIGTVTVGAPSLRSAAARRQESITLTWWDYQREANGEAVDNMLRRYTESHPNVTIERTYIPFADLKQRLLQGATAGELPDIVLIDNPDHQAFASLGVLLDITDRVTEWGQQSAYFEGPWASTVWQDRNYGIPHNSNCLVLFYNTDMLNAAGVTPPTNWDELRAAAATLTEGNTYGFAVSAIKSEEGTFQWLPFLWATGEDIPTLDSEGGRAALQLWVDLVNQGHMSQGILNWKQGDVAGQFLNGLAAMMVNGPWEIPGLQAGNPDLSWAVAVLPSQKTSASILGGENLAITTGTRNEDAAWELMAWTQQPDVLKQYLIEAGHLPSRADLAQDETWTGDPILSVFTEQLKVARPRAYGDKYPEISAAIQDAIQSAISGRTPVEDALATAQQIINPLLPSS